MNQDRQSPCEPQPSQAAASAIVRTQQRQTLAEDIALLVIREHHRRTRSRKHATESLDQPTSPGDL